MRPAHRSIDKVDQTMAEIQEQTQLANEVSEAISSNQYAGVDFDEVRHTGDLFLARVADVCVSRTSSSRSWQISSRRSSTTGSWRTRCPYTIRQDRAEWKTVRRVLRSLFVTLSY